MKKWVILSMFGLLMFSVTGCMFDKKDVLAGFEQPDVIIENINKNLDRDMHQFTKIKEYGQWFWRIDRGIQLSFVRNSYYQGVSLLLCYDAEDVEQNEAGSVLRGILKTVADDDSKKVIEKLQLADDESVETEFGNYIIQKVSAKNLSLVGERGWWPDEEGSKRTFGLPVTYVRIERKLDREALEAPSGMEELEYNASLEGLKDIVRKDENLRKAAQYFREEVQQEGVKPVNVDKIKILQ